MKAGHGIVFREGSNHVDMGPLYTDFERLKGPHNLTLTEYKMQHGSNSNNNDYLNMLK